MRTIKLNQIEANRILWKAVAQANGWYFEPFYIQLWVNSEGSIIDSVSHKGMSSIGHDLIQDYDTEEVLKPDQYSIS